MAGGKAKAFEQVIKTARSAFNSGKTRSVEFRLDQLNNVGRMLKEQGPAIADSLQKQFKKSRFEAQLYELVLVSKEIKWLMKAIKKFAAGDTLPFNLLASLDSAKILRQPFGLVLVIGAIAAGNCVIIKPSEVAPKTATVISEIVPQYLDRECYHVVEADAAGTAELLTNKFDYICYTGSGMVGKSIMTAAAKHLTPLTLELGGKSPCFVDDSADFHVAAKRIMWGKLINLGQTCIAPDYVLCSQAAEQGFVKVAKEVLKEWYGADLQASPDLPRIINERHCLRIQGLLMKTKGTIVCGGKVDVKDLWVEPTIVVDVKEDDALMEDELFGPILPIVRTNSVEEAITFINSKPRPLALYSFAKKGDVNEKIVAETISGGVCINDVIWHNAWHGLPFGGVGDSGFGNYHGKYSLETFSHSRSVLTRSFSWLSEKLGEARYPPYTTGKLNFLQMTSACLETFNVNHFGTVVSHAAAAGLGAALVAVFLQH